MFRVSSKILAQALENGKISRSRQGTYFLPGYENTPEKLFQEALLLKDSRTTSCGVKDGLFIKRYNRKKFWKSVKRIFGYPRAFRCLAGSLLLEELPLLTPRVLHASRYFLVTEALDMEDTLFLSDAPEKVRDFLVPLASLHKQGIAHGDLSLRNIYFDRKKEQFGLIDFDGADFFLRPLTGNERIHELARVFSSCFRILKKRGEKVTLEQITEECLPFYEEAVSMKFRRETLLKHARYFLKP